MSGELRSVCEHQRAVCALMRSRPAATVPIDQALALVLAQDVVAATDLPGFDNSAMDGYAVRAAEVATATAAAPVELPVAGDIAAGDTRHRTLEAGTAMRIMTGAPMPTGADAVVPVEESDGGTTVARLTLAAEPGRHVRRAGEDVRAGDIVIGAGTLLSPGHIALAAAANVAAVWAYPRPRVLVLSTGDEIVPVGSELAFAQIVDSNSLMLAALVRAAGADLVGRHQVGDDAAALTAFLSDPPGDPDLVVTSGGVSMGAYDTVKEVLSATGSVEFVKVAMRPGMPQGCGVVGTRHTPIITLPGNPVSSLVSFHVFVGPALRVAAGRTDGGPPGLPMHRAVAGQGWASVAGKLEFTRVRETDGVVVPARGQGSHMLGALGAATGLAAVPVGVDRVRPGQEVQVLPLLGVTPAGS